MKTKQKSTPKRFVQISNNQTEPSGSMPDMNRKQGNDGSRTLEVPKDNNSHPHSLNIDTSEWDGYTEEQLEKLLHSKLKGIYIEACKELLNMGYYWEAVEKAVLINGRWYGPNNIMTNIITHCIDFMRSGSVTNGRIAPKGGEGFQDFSELAKYSLGVMVVLIQQTQRNLRKADVMRYLLAKNLDASPATTIVPQILRTGDQFGSATLVDGNLKSSEDRDCGGPDSSCVNKKARLEINFDAPSQLTEMESALRKATCQVALAAEALRRLENRNLEIKAAMEASKLRESQLDKVLKEVEESEKKCVETLVALRKQMSQLQEQVKEEKQQQLQLHKGFLQAKNGQEEAEVKWRQTLEGQERAIALLSEKKRLVEITEANLKRDLAFLSEKLEMDSQRLKDDMQSLEHELFHHQSPHHSSHSPLRMLGTDESPGNQIEVIPPERSLHDRRCIICKNKDACIFRPCVHRGVCANCDNNHWRTLGTKCPRCSVQIVQKLKIHDMS